VVRVAVQALAATLEGARLAWKLLAGREGIERRYWAQDEQGKWVQKS
jgi:DNA polymerase-3 subunit chi